MGSVRLLTDASGNSASSYNYSAFGATRTSSGSVANEVRFTGERIDTESGLEFLRARTYDPSTGTFLSRDTWGITPTDGQSLDLYAYTGNDPIDRVDPSGHCWGICIDIKPPSLPIPDLSAAAHSALGVVSIVPGPIGSAAAVADAGLYAYEGDYESAAISLVAVVPFGGPILSKGEQALKVVNKVRQADRVANTGADIEKAAKAIDKAESTVKSVPNPWGRLGGPQHVAKVNEVAADMEARGLQTVREVKFSAGAGGTGRTRYADVVGYRNGVMEEVGQVGRQTKSGSPIFREREAMTDIFVSPDRDPSASIRFIRYR